jgi:hypothetical protein
MIVLVALRTSTTTTISLSCAASSTPLSPNRILITLSFLVKTQSRNSYIDSHFSSAEVSIYT